MDSVSGKVCGSADIPVSTCNANRLCSKMFKIPSPACPSPADIIVHVYGSNMLGRGPSLNSTLGN